MLFDLSLRIFRKPALTLVFFSRASSRRNQLTVVYMTLECIEGSISKNESDQILNIPQNFEVNLRISHKMEDSELITG